MIPVKLELKGFTSYEEEIIDFTGITMASIQGGNGTGKTSLVVDAILVAGFGFGTKGNSLEEYVQTGKDSFYDRYTFYLQNLQYRITREYSISKGKTKLKLESQIGDDWQDESCKNLTDTQKKIESILHADGKVFAIAAMIQQGESDIFSADMSDGERKRILSAILRLEIWDEVWKLSNEKLRELKEKKMGLDNEVQRCEKLIAEKEIVQGRKASAEQELILVQEEKIATETLIQDIKNQESGNDLGIN